jgi:RNA polymerase sigma factor (sigma-70 family)
MPQRFKKIDPKASKPAREDLDDQLRSVETPKPIGDQPGGALLPESSITRFIDALRAGDPAAAQRIWQVYVQRLVELARAKLRGAPRRVADEQDVVQNAFASFFRGVEQGRFPQLADRHDLWQVLVMLTARKALNQMRDERRQKRGGGKVKDEAWLGDQNPEAEENALARVIGREPSSDFAAQVAEECARLLDCLGDEQLCSIALRKMESFTNQEVAAQLGCSLPTVERKLHRIRLIWEKETKR